MFKRHPMYRILITLFLLLVSRAGLACTCEQLSAEELIDNASTVYVGRAVKSELIDDSNVETTFDVEQLYKGDAKSKASVFSSFSSAVCGVEYKVGFTYLVLANKDRRVSICTGHEKYYSVEFEDRADVVSTGILKQLRKNEKHNQAQQ
jgi:hypothetical protein